MSGAAGAAPGAAGALTLLPEGLVTVGPGIPLTAAYCAERAANAIATAETAPDAVAVGRWLGCAEHWRTLACSLATNAAMNRPREDRDDRGRR